MRMSEGEGARMLSYLPLSHVAERSLVEHGLLCNGMHVFFAESLETFTQDLQRGCGLRSSKACTRRCRRSSSSGC